MRDLELLSAHFLTCQLPQHKTYLRKYFTGPIQERLVVYFLVFPYDGRFRRYYNNIIDHTGLYCSERWIYNLLKRFSTLEQRMTRAEIEKDHVTVALIKSGKWQAKKDSTTQLDDGKTDNHQQQAAQLPTI